MNNLQVIERNNQRVMTTAVLAEEYGTTTPIISNNFNRNKERYIESKHFYCLEGDELREFRANHQFDDLPTNINKLYLWTEKGALLHAKSLNTDRAWEMYDFLVESYFTKKDTFLEGLSSEMKALILQDKKIQAVENKVNTVQADLQEFKQDLPLLAVECERITKAVKKKGVTLLGGKNSPAYHNNSLRTRVYTDIHREVKRQFGVFSYKAIKRSQCDLAVKIVEAYELPIVLFDEVLSENSQVAIA